ncbi:cell wall hydrolase [Paenibacillus abyssi]|uniref:Copper amine oxidase n=1 Tax=Paenibacillus abyssi TaxID=1340531 RepID=A0A917CNP0_9BACL|nr:cell wall hydrolase [Paenibacillus abyssi]GGF94200.1 hypothetical protein GCM10010916_09450 [Paenibacillus abyssi]
MRKRLPMILLITYAASILMMPAGAKAAGAADTTIHVNGSPVTTSRIMQNNQQMVPAEFFRKLNASVSWSSKYRAAVINRNSMTIGFPSGKSFTDYDLQGLNQWKRDELNTKTIHNGGRIYIPLAYTARKLGMEVTYSARSKKTFISMSGKLRINSVNAANTEALAGSVSQDDLKWLYRITEAEAGGESYRGKQAVAASILNRVKSPDWPDKIKDTIFQVTTYNGKSYYQYSPVLDKRIYNVTPSAETKRAVQAALNGEDPSKGAIVFYNPDKTDNQWVRDRKVTVKIGNHVFAK